jgi:hypothetical protein
MTTAEWKRKITGEWMSLAATRKAYPDINPTKEFDEQFSILSVESLLFYAMAYCMMVLEKIFNDRTAELEAKFTSLCPHTIGWYVAKIKAFQYNVTLPIDTDVYPTINEEKQIVKYCSVTTTRGVLNIKIAGADSSGRPVRLSDSSSEYPMVLKKITAYINRVKDAGVHFVLSSGEADKFSCQLLVHYDPLHNVTIQTIKENIKRYLSSMPFDGVYSNMALVDTLQAVEGIKVAEVISSEASYGSNPPVNIVSLYRPDAGYMELDEGKTQITLEPYI